MGLYHGSNMVVSAPRIPEPTHTLDFGPGFYTTLNRDQAAPKALSFLRFVRKEDVR